MDLSFLRRKDPTPGVPRSERRRRVRHKLHTPVYASFAGPRTSMVLDLSELLDVHEDGFSVQTGEKLEVNRPVNLSLELVETKSYVHGTGHVVWSDGPGRAAIRFSGLADPARQLLKEWLFVNLLIGCANHDARARQLAQRDVEALPPPVDEPAVPEPDLSGLLSALEVVRREIRAAMDFDAALQLVTERALGFTGASGAALAYLTADGMICRARAGDPAPPLGARVDVRQGLSGECVRTARLISCRDTETDPRVDRELCRALGMGSILAAPIVSDYRVVGLLEAFSSRAHAFTSAQETALDRLAYLVPAQSPRSAPSASPVAEALPPPSPSVLPASPNPETLPEPATQGQDPPRGVPVRRFHLLLLVMALAITFLALGYVSAPAIQKFWWAKPPTVVQATSSKDSPSAPANRLAEARTLEDLRQLAAQGNTDAQYVLGARYHNGDGVPQSDAQAVQWFLRAAEQGHVVAQATLGAYYWAGRGAPQDLSKAYFWSVLARAGNDEASKYRVAVLTSHMTRAQVLAAQQQAEAWIRQHTTGAKPIPH
jgi:GAF domain-containing protein/Sel1 repeat-containing protein/PilZ domain-containing protein